MFCHMRSTSLRIVGVTIGDPFDPHSWSGSNFHLFSTLRTKGVLAGVVDARTGTIDRIEKAASYQRNREVWLQRYFAGASRLRTPCRFAMSWVGARRARAVDSRPDALLQVGAYYDFSGVRGLKPRLLCSYHDGNIAVYTQRQDLLLRSGARYIRAVRAYERGVYDALDLIMCRTDWLRDSFIEDFGQSPDKVVNVGSGANFESIPEPVTRDLGVPRLLFVGKDFRRKGGPQVLAVFELLRAARSDAEHWIVGPKEKPSTQEGVRFFGRIDRSHPEGEALMRKLYEDATIFVMPPLYEPSASVFLEAMGYGLPCIGSTFGSIPEFILEGVTGHLVPPGDVRALYGKLMKLVDDAKRAKAMGDAGRLRFLENFTWDAVGRRVVDEIDNRIGPVRRGGPQP